MRKFKLPRKLKKKYQKDASVFYNCWRSKESWEWFYHKRRIEIRCMEVILTYPQIATNKQLLEFYQKNYPNDKTSHMLCNQNRNRWDKYNSKL